jgi:isopentenyl-diphosphate delta-isomerase
MWSSKRSGAVRKKRKKDHLHFIRNLDDGPDTSGFEDIHFVHNCLPEINPGEINTTTIFCRKQVKVPLMINAMTGGIPEAVEINRALARAARKLGIPLAVGSQAAALQDKSCRFSYEVVREENPSGFILANVSCAASPQEAREAVEMIKADALQLHLNAAQEVMMSEGEGDLYFRGYRQKIKHLAETLPIPVIVKETGCGIAREQALELLDTGIAALDIGGKGGANFILVENCRHHRAVEQTFSRWGFSTAVSLVEVVESAGAQLDIVAAGGIRNGLDVAKALSIGANLVGVAAPLLRSFYQGGGQAVENYLFQLKKELRQTMLLLGACNLAELQQKPLVILGDTGKWLGRRGFEPSRFARRGTFPGNI